jgi:hypothetical protein
VAIHLKKEEFMDITFNYDLEIEKKYHPENFDTHQDDTQELMTTLKDILTDLGHEVQGKNDHERELALSDFYQQIDRLIESRKLRSILRDFIEEVQDESSETLEDTAETYVEYITKQVMGA